jgi:lactoylglutathione lyase
MFQRIDYLMVVVSDMRRSVEFYRDRLGLPLKFESPDWTEFQTGTTTLALHGGGEPRPRAAGAGEEKKTAGSCSFGFSVSDLSATYDALRSRGVSFAMPPRDREGEGIRLAIALDPDGLPISFAESLNS